MRRGWVDKTERGLCECVCVCVRVRVDLLEDCSMNQNKRLDTDGMTAHGCTHVDVLEYRYARNLIGGGGLAVVV